MRDGGVLCRHTPSNPLAHSKRETEGLFHLSTLSTPSLARNMRRRGFPLSTHHNQPLPHSNCKTEGFSVDTHPLQPPRSLETRDGGCKGTFQSSFLIPFQPPSDHPTDFWSTLIQPQVLLTESTSGSPSDGFRRFSRSSSSSASPLS
jgi:hypothetical protein